MSDPPKPPPTSFGPNMTREDLVSAIAEGIAKERGEYQEVRRQLAITETVIGLIAVVSFVMMVSSSNGFAGVCFVVSAVGLAIILRVS